MSDQTVEIPVVEAVAPTPAVEVAAPETAIAEAVVAEAAVTAPEAVTASADVADSKTEEKAKILKQVEFYFSDSNLPQDKFMTELVKKSQDGWVPIARIGSFKRMRDFTDKALIVEALRESKDLLEVSEDNEKVRRKTNFVPAKDHFQRSIYAKGLGEETPSLQLELEQFFGTFGDVKQVRMRRNNETGAFKGSVFVEYATLDEANKISASKLEYSGKELLVMSKAAYCEMKAKELGLDPSEIKTRSQNRGFLSDNKKTSENKKRGREDEKVETFEDVKNKVIKISGVSGSENTGLKDIKESLKEHFRYGYVHWPRDSNVLEVQIKNEDLDAEKVVADLKSKGFSFNGATPEITVVTEEEAQRFFDEKKAWEANMASRESNNSGGRGRGGSRGRGGGRGRGGARGRGGHDRKKIRTQD